MSATAQLRDFEGISFQEDFIMSGFGKRQHDATPLRSSFAVADGSSGERLPFSFLGLAGSAVVSALLMLLMFNMTYAAMLEYLAADPKLSEMGSDVVRIATSLTKWSMIAGGAVTGCIYCVIAHWVAYFLVKTDLWVFALTGLICVLLLWVLQSSAMAFQRPFLVTLLYILSGAATTSTYWLIARWRAA
jgi:hypothetical protein